MALTLLFVLTPLIALLIVGSITLAIRLPQIAGEVRSAARSSATEMASRIEEFLYSLEGRMNVVASAVDSIPDEDIYKLLTSARSGRFDAMLLLEANGILSHASVKNPRVQYVDDLVGIDMSSNKLFREAKETGVTVWSDTHLSAISGIVTVGLAIPVAGSGRVIIAELPLKEIVSISRATTSDQQVELWIIDRLGEVIADTGATDSGRLNLYNLPIVRLGLSGLPLPQELSYGGRDFYAWAEFSEKLGWLFVSRVPRGLANPDVRDTVSIILAAFVATSLLGALLAPLWAQLMSRAVRSVIDQARLVASGRTPDAWPSSWIKEFGQLSKDLEAMAEALVSREQALRELNEKLEARVQERTRDLALTNEELTEALGNLRTTQSELVEAEKLAALGRLVAGVAHELNTPLGNSKLSLSAQGDEIEKFAEQAEKGLRRSDLTAFIDRVRQGTSVAALNVERACDLVVSFKQVAVDRTASYRRSFKLKELVDGTLVTLQPSIRNGIGVLVGEIPERIEMDSYPGEFGQVITNLVDNAAKHAFTDDQPGTVRLTVGEPSPDSIALMVEDDGCGMAQEVVERVFNPFFTTKFGQGGTGLGLHIAYNAVTNVLGGTISVTSAVGKGSNFTVTVPLVAPKPDSG